MRKREREKEEGRSTTNGPEIEVLEEVEVEFEVEGAVEGAVEVAAEAAVEVDAAVAVEDVDDDEGRGSDGD